MIMTRCCTARIAARLRPVFQARTSRACRPGLSLRQPDLKWDLGRPYQIRHDAAGTCVHNDAETHGCGVYADRPGVCRRYSCANDERIWSDFENMQLNTAWIEENLHATGPRLAHATMVQLQDPVLRPAAGRRT